MNRNSLQRRGSGPLSITAALLYALLLIYGTLFPLQGWVTPSFNPLEMMYINGLKHTSWSDVITNLLVYMPLGFLLMRSLSGILSCSWCKVLAALLVGGLLSLTLELMQAHIPGRTPSLYDLVLNTAGSGIGAAIALILKRENRLGQWLYRLRLTYIKQGATADVGLLTLGMWALAQLSPLVPSLDLDNLRNGLKPLVKVLQDPQLFSWLQFAEYAAAIAALGILYANLQRYRYMATTRFLAFAASILLLKVLVVNRQLSMEALLGLATAALLMLLLKRLRTPGNLIASAVLLLLAIVLEGIQPGTTSAKSSLVSAFNWVPFRGHLSNNIIGIIDILAGIWPVLGLSYLSANLWTKGFRKVLVIGGAAFIFITLMGLEWFQRFIPGRSADITDVLVAMAAWFLSWGYITHSPEPSQEKSKSFHAHQNHRFTQSHTLIAVSILLVVFAITAHVFSGKEFSENTESEQLFPSPEMLPPPDLPGFRHSHPRLPAPTLTEQLRWKEKRPLFVRQKCKRAKGGKGSLYDAIFCGYVDPGSQDMDLLFKRLMDLKITWRGHEQAKPLAMAYDWLYDQWNPRQREKLARKVVEASNYLIKLIRNDKLSPYNVYLYNSPFQALMATSIATWGDVREADPPMRWSVHYWKDYVLPVWRQILGTTGGWHEGGEYVGIGIGQAIYQVPSMWRKATGEDLFASEPGIRGFADFLVYRTRPDGTHMRWGDALFFDRRVPDRIPLAIETHHKAAYSLRCPKPGLPTAWPWGPLSSNEFCDKKAVENLPLQKHFDGLGMVIARSDWSNDATYVTFKAGDNFWSHTHLDQGAFTLFKGGPLAIDSGYYGPGYGADHHMNYSYQTIAHNVITVTDPEDNVPKPPKKRDQEPRPIANDGGQRRIGSGWGVRAPLDLKEWEENRDTYHTGKIVKYYEGENLVVAVADITPAYTNLQSGNETFAHRTFRVKKYWRTFIYDRSTDLVVIHDDVVSADPAFLKRSLIHTLEKPTLDKFGFTVDTAPIEPPRRPRRKAGHLQAFVLFPEDARINIVGGPGKEFLVDGQNYDAEGAIWKKVSQRKKNAPEPGRWRVEISPPTQQEHDQFLMILVPGDRDLPPFIESVHEGKDIGTRIIGLERILKLTFPADRQGVIIKITEQKEPLTLDLTLPLAPEIEPEISFWTRIRKLIWPR